MNIRVIVLVLVLSLGLNVFLFKQASDRSLVVAVPDGDSLDLADGRRIRLLGLDAPERGRCGAEEAKDRLTDLALSHRVHLENTVKDSFGRILADVFIKDPNKSFHINQFLVSEGLVKYSGGVSQYKNTLSEASKQAQVEKRGIYSPTCRSVNSKTNCTIKGNIRSGVKTYFPMGCGNYDQVIIDLSYGDKWFCTLQEARNAGFALAKECTE